MAGSTEEQIIPDSSEDASRKLEIDRTGLRRMPAVPRSNDASSCMPDLRLL